MKILVLGGGGFIGGHLATRLTREGHEVIAVDVKNIPDYAMACSDYVKLDLRDSYGVNALFSNTLPDEVYQLAADMGGAEYIFSGDNDANVMHNSAMINLNVVKAACSINLKIPKVFFSSSACVYRDHPYNPYCAEGDAYPAEPDSAYGWEKLFSENLYAAANRNYGLPVRIARFHNIFGPKGTWRGGKEKAPAAIMRKVAEAQDDDAEIDIFGTGEQTRSFLYIDECIEGVLRLMASGITAPTNIGSSEMVSIKNLVSMVGAVACKSIAIKHIEGPIGVHGRCSDNTLVHKRLGWQPTEPLIEGIHKTYPWIKEQVRQWKS